MNSARMALRQTARPASQARFVSTSRPSRSSMGLYLSLAGLAGLGGWYAMGGSQSAPLGKMAAEEAKALSSEEFRPFKLKEVRPYNHDSSMYVQCT